MHRIRAVYLGSRCSGFFVDTAIDLKEELSLMSSRIREAVDRFTEPIFLLPDQDVEHRSGSTTAFRLGVVELVFRNDGEAVERVVLALSSTDDPTEVAGFFRFGVRIDFDNLKIMIHQQAPRIGRSRAVRE